MLTLETVRLYSMMSWNIAKYWVTASDLVDELTVWSEDKDIVYGMVKCRQCWMADIRASTQGRPLIGCTVNWLLSPRWLARLEENIKMLPSLSTCPATLTLHVFFFSSYLLTELHKPDATMPPEPSRRASVRRKLYPDPRLHIHVPPSSFRLVLASRVANDQARWFESGQR